MQILAPSAWEGASVVTVVIVLALLHGLALVRGWIVWGPAHREIMRLKDDAINHSQGREQADQDTIRTLADTIAEQKVASQLAAHASQSIHEVVGRAP
ncbi:hypothetical protein LRM64_17515 [Prescottella equi]|uniref:Uncharacterized protein n=1 Tax=uncultured Caudovirales phage TaxID=2100421 RepID=A0A2H4JI65_9CAUD|nr:hypothetical protein [Prescottella equi]ASN72801.1 hypothetical protein 7S6_2 [uncultured Caudovirales phage]MCU7531405.1 hypothetical protein [Prescottella equi]MCU7535481.1 hypothetical protein [Prescottella equi]